MNEGVNFMDTAEGYDGSNSEKTIGEYLTTPPDDRKKLFIVTKTGDGNSAGLESHWEASLERLKTDYVDALSPQPTGELFLQVGNPPSG